VQLQYSREENVPLLAYFKQLQEPELVALAVKGSHEFLTSLSENAIPAFIQKATEGFIKNQLPSIDREQVVTDDITIVSFVRRKSLRYFLTRYTSSFEQFSQVMEEVDHFIMISESASFNAYLSVQQDKINRINRELEQRQSDLLEAQELAEMGSFLWDLKERKSQYTPGIYKIFDFTGSSTMESFMQDVHEDDRHKVQAALDRALGQDGIYECEYRYGKNGKEKIIWSRGLVSFENDKPVYMKGTIMDITQKNKLLDRLQQSETLHKQAQALTHIGNWSWDIESNQVTWSDEMYRIYGLEPQSEQVTLERFISLMHPDDRDNRLREIQESLNTLEAKDYVLRIINPDGAVKVLRGKGEVITDRHKNPVQLVGTCQDITLEYNLNKNLQEKEAYLQQIISHAPDAVIVIDSDSLITLWNPKTEAIFGWKAAEVIGKSLTDTIVPPQHRAAHLAGMKRILETGVVTILNKTLELTAITKAGDEIDISLTISQSVQDNKYSFIAFLRDISKEKQLQQDLKKKTKQLEQANITLGAKNTALQAINNELQSFNYVASHDLKEPLRKIQIYSGRILDKREQLQPVFAEYFDRILKSAARMQLLIEDLLMYSQATDFANTFETVDLNLVLAEVKSILSVTIEEKKAVVRSMLLPVIHGIPFQLQQLFVNLIGNALKYSKEGIAPEIDITTRETFETFEEHGRHYLEITIKDNGIGFENENSEKIFGLFQRLHNKEDYSGTGIGLAICKKIVTNHRGFIVAESSPFSGAIFKVYLPLNNIV
jgi:PAS domain S-box-containing protein